MAQVIALNSATILRPFWIPACGEHDAKIHFIRPNPAIARQTLSASTVAPASCTRTMRAWR